MATMTSPVVIAVDAGTGSARALAFDLDGRIVARASREWTHRATTSHPGGTDFDTKSGWLLIAEALREVVEALDGREIAAVGASSMREGFVLYDEHGAEIFGCPNTDGRARAQAEDLVREGIADRIYAVGGDWVSITAPARFRWLAQQAPEVLAAARNMGMISDWVTYKLTGRFTTDPTCGSSSAMFDLATRQWSPELAELIGVNPDILPEVLECGTIAGQVTDAAAAETGLPIGTPIVVGGADTQLALHGIGAVQGVPTVVAGTFWQATALLDEALIDPERRLRTLCHVEPNSWMVEGIGFLSGLAMRWFRDAMCPDATAIAKERGISAFDVLEEWASEVPAGSNGLVAVLANVMQADAWHHASPSFVNVDFNDAGAFHRGTFVRAIEEAAAYVVRAHLEILDEVTEGEVLRQREIILTGGSSGGKLWPQIIADVIGVTANLSPVTEATAYGVARLAASAAGFHLPPANSTERAVRPSERASAEYDEHFDRWLRVYDAQVRATVRSGLTPLFTPPGGLAYRAPLSTRTRNTKENIAHG